MGITPVRLPVEHSKSMVLTKVRAVKLFLTFPHITVCRVYLRLDVICYMGFGAM